MSKPEEALLFVRDVGEDKISMEALVELLKAVIEKDKPFRFQAFGFSMHPFIKDSNYITISPLNSHHPRLGDIVAFIQPGTRRLIVHRVVKIKGDRYLIKGDNIFAPDGLIPKVNILGYVTKIEKDGKIVLFGSGFEKTFIALLSRKNFKKQSTPARNPIFEQILISYWRLIMRVMCKISAIKLPKNIIIHIL